MSRLVKLRQRIKTIQTVQKITQAMRLVSMSIHSQLNNQTNLLKNYQSELDKIASAVKHFKSAPINKGIKTNKKLVILVGSQKGLCSSFNQDISQKFYKIKQTKHKVELLVIGKKLIDLIGRKNNIHKKIPKFSHTSINEITNKIFNYITEQQNFTEVIFITNKSKSFFSHKTQSVTLIPMPKCNSQHPVPKEEYTWEQPQSEIATKLAHKQLKLNIYTSLFDSLVAEYAARFRSMDNATRNADNLLETTQRQYNKMRQAKITGELVELSAIFQTK